MQSPMGPFPNNGGKEAEDYSPPRDGSWLSETNILSSAGFGEMTADATSMA